MANLVAEVDTIWSQMDDVCHDDGLPDASEPPPEQPPDAQTDARPPLEEPAEATAAQTRVRVAPPSLTSGSTRCAVGWPGSDVSVARVSGSPLTAGCARGMGCTTDGAGGARGGDREGQHQRQRLSGVGEVGEDCRGCDAAEEGDCAYRAAVGGAEGSEGSAGGQGGGAEGGWAGGSHCWS